MCPREGVTESLSPSRLLTALSRHSFSSSSSLHTRDCFVSSVSACAGVSPSPRVRSVPCSMDPSPRPPALELRWQDAIGGGTSSHTGPCRPLSFPTDALCVWSYLHPRPTSQGRLLWLSTIEIKRRKGTLSRGAYRFHGLFFPEGAGFCLLSFPSSPGNSWHCLCFRSL